jgi:uncharacterized protein (UPF0212 family)
MVKVSEVYTRNDFLALEREVIKFFEGEVEEAKCPKCNSRVEVRQVENSYSAACTGCSLHYTSRGL